MSTQRHSKSRERATGLGARAHRSRHVRQVAADLAPWDAGGRIPRPVRVGRSTLWRVEELHAWIAAGCPTREHWEGIYGRQTPCGVARAEHTVSRVRDSIMDPR